MTENVATLLAYDCWALLEGADVARVAWLGPDGVALVPINYVVADGCLWFRTEPGSALARESGGGPLVIEIDHVDTETRDGWSVVVRGKPELIDQIDVPQMVVEMRVWPIGPHQLFVRVQPDQITGRRLWGTGPVEGDAHAGA